jgi:hypothetical protein
MKAAIITLHNVCNYGTQLQALATQEKLKQYFDEVVFVDYRRPDTYGLGLMNTFAKGNPIKMLAVLPTLIYWRRLFGNFQKQYLNLTSKTYLEYADFERLDDFADVYISGSDQVWNTGWNKGVIPPFYLSFAPDSKPKFAYASSFGKVRLTEDEVAQSKKYIDRFDCISVREESGVSILKEQYRFDGALRVLDPTLVMSPEFWREVAPPPKIKSDYVLIYNLKKSHELDEYAVAIAKHTGYKLYRLCTRLDQIFRSGTGLVMPDILEFVTLIDHAKLVITDSFHATAFAMNLNTEPICVYPESYSGRISEFLDLIESPQRHAKNFADFEILDRRVNFTWVNEILEYERKKTEQFLMKIAKWKR